MNYLRSLLRVELFALGGLALCALAFVAYLVLAVLLTESSAGFESDAVGVLVGMFGLFFVFGFVPAALFGAPIYTLLLQRGRANWLTALALGLAPGFVFLVPERQLALFAFLAGTAVALFTHFWCRGTSRAT